MAGLVNRKVLVKAGAYTQVPVVGTGFVVARPANANVRVETNSLDHDRFECLYGQGARNLEAFSLLTVYNDQGYDQEVLLAVGTGDFVALISGGAGGSGDGVSSSLDGGVLNIGAAAELIAANANRVSLTLRADRDNTHPVWVVVGGVKVMPVFPNDAIELPVKGSFSVERDAAATVNQKVYMLEGEL